MNWMGGQKRNSSAERSNVWKNKLLPRGRQICSMSHPSTEITFDIGGATITQGDRSAPKGQCPTVQKLLSDSDPFSVINENHGMTVDEARERFLAEPDWACLEEDFIPAIRQRPIRQQAPYIAPKRAQKISPAGPRTVEITYLKIGASELEDDSESHSLADEKDRISVDVREAVSDDPISVASCHSQSSYKNEIEPEELVWYPDPSLLAPITFPRDQSDSDEDPFHIRKLLGPRKRKVTEAKAKGSDKVNRVLASDVATHGGSDDTDNHEHKRSKRTNNESGVASTWDQVDFFAQTENMHTGQQSPDSRVRPFSTGHTALGSDLPSQSQISSAPSNESMVGIQMHSSSLPTDVISPSSSISQVY